MGNESLTMCATGACAYYLDIVPMWVLRRKSFFWNRMTLDARARPENRCARLPQELSAISARAQLTALKRRIGSGDSAIENEAYAELVVTEERSERLQLRSEISVDCRARFIKKENQVVV